MRFLLARLGRAPLVALVAFVLAACAVPAAPEPTPVPEPSPQRRPPTAPPAPTTTPIPLGTAGPAPAGATPAAVVPLPVVGSDNPNCLGLPQGPKRLAGLRAGINIPTGAPVSDQLLDLAAGLNVDWIRATALWSDLEPQRGAYRWESLDDLADGARARGLRVLLRVTGSPAWAAPGGGMPERADDFAAFTRALADHARGKIDGYEIWEAPNTAAANGGQVVDPGRYVDLLAAAHGAIKQADPCALVLNGALQPTASRDRSVAVDDLVFYRGMMSYRSGLFRQVHDVLAVALNTGNVEGNGRLTTTDPRESRGIFGHLRIIRDEMIAADAADRHAWVVEAGYDLAGPSAVSVDEQGRYLATLFRLVSDEYPYASALFVRDLAPAQAVAEGDYALLNGSGAPRGSYAILAGALGEERASRASRPAIEGTDLRLLWEQRFIARLAAPIVIGPDGGVYVLGRYAVSGFDADGAYRTGQYVGANKRLLGAAVDKEGRLFVASDNGTLWSYGAGGATRWGVLVEGNPTTPPLVSSDGSLVYVGTGRERLAAYATDDGALRWEASLDGSIPGAPALGEDGTIYLGGSNGALFAIAPDGSARWQTPVGGFISRQPHVRGATIAAVTDDGQALTLGTDGSVRWQTPLGAPSAGFGASADGTIYATAGEQVHAVGPDGARRWSVPIGGGATAPGVGDGGRVFVGGGDGRLTVLEPDGRVAGVFALDDPIDAPPKVGRDGLVYVISQDDSYHLLAFGPEAAQGR